MLIQKKAFSPGDIVSLRLVTGEEIIGKVVSYDANHVVITKPVALQVGMAPTGEVHMAFAPFMVSVPEESEFHFSSDKLLVSPLVPREEVRSKYIQATTGLAVPNQKAQVLRA